ncbi:DUF722 domain-containing protein [Clostridium perfringens]|nr:DUF722 domain-containing protein [Clostridium perfringens]EJT6532480.1 DUF722 domain-containing protein [Clostridium perfringens]
MFNKTKEEIKEVENILKGYGDLIEDIELIKDKIEELEEEYIGCGAIGYDEFGGATNKFNSSVENEVVSKENRKRELVSKLKEFERLKKRIDKAVNSLVGVDREVIELKYINKRLIGWKEIAYTVDYSESHCRKRIKPRALKHMIKFILY